MNTTEARRALKKTARQNGVPLSTVLQEIQIAISAGIANPDPHIQAFWRGVPRKGEVPASAKLAAHMAGMR